MFEELDTKKDELKILSYGFGDSNLEDVFLKVSEANEFHSTSSNS